jgi:superfamily II DNA or RNA helicase
LYKPRDYQLNCVDAVYDYASKHKSFAIVLATGLGKSTIASMIIKRWMDELRGSVLFLAHTMELIEQAADRMIPFLNYRPGVEMNVQTVDVETFIDDEMVIVASMQTMRTERRLAKYRRKPFSLIIVDEAHRAVSSSYRRIIDYYRELNPNLIVLGMTATPGRSDDVSLGLVFDGGEAFRLDIGWGIDKGYLCPFVSDEIVCENLEFTSIGSKKNEFGQADFNPATLDGLMRTTENVAKLGESLLQHAEGRSTLVFTSSVAHAHETAAYLNGKRFGCAMAVDGTMAKGQGGERDRAVEMFRAGELQYLLNVGVYVEGFDAPICSCVAMARPTKSTERYTQMLGRGLRPLPGCTDSEDPFERQTAIFTSDKPNALVLDYVGASRLGSVTAKGILDGNYDVDLQRLLAEERKAGNKDYKQLAEQAAALRAMQKAIEEQAKYLEVTATFSRNRVDPRDNTRPLSHAVPRGGSTDGQIAALVKFGVQEHTAAGYSSRQASAVLTNLRETRCTVGQAKVLRRAGIPTDGINADRAGRIIDALASNNWQLPAQLPE